LLYINGFDHPAIISGAGTMGIEILEQVPDVDAVLIPVGGAGLIAGVSLAIKMLNPRVTVIGVEPVSCPSFTRALQEGKPVKAECTPTLADGLAVPTVGENAFQIARKFVDKVITVRERYIALSVLRMLEIEKTVVEGAGVIGLAPLLSHKLPELKGKKVVIALCGGNIDITVLGRVIDRGLAADGRLIQFEVAISDRPGGLAAFTKLIAETGASVKDIYHERAFLDADLMTIMVRCVVETRDAKHAQELFQHLTDAGHVINFATSSLHILTKEQQEQHMQQKIGMEEIQKKQLSSQVVSVIGDTVEVLPEIQQASEETIDNKHEKN
jgi:threonine dehydratase